MFPSSKDFFCTWPIVAPESSESDSSDGRYVTVSASADQPVYVYMIIAGLFFRLNPDGNTLLLEIWTKS